MDRIRLHQMQTDWMAALIQLKNVSFCLIKTFFLSCVKRSRLISATSSAIYSWWSPIWAGRASWLLFKVTKTWNLFCLVLPSRSTPTAAAALWSTTATTTCSGRASWTTSSTRTSTTCTSSAPTTTTPTGASSPKRSTSGQSERPEFSFSAVKSSPSLRDWNLGPGN